VTEQQQPGPVPARRFPTPLQAVVLTLAGFAMAFFGCLGALSQYDSSEVLFGIALVVSIVGALALVTGLFMVALLFVQGVVRAFRDSRKPPPSSPGATPPDASVPPPPGTGSTPPE
jgi:hypothetical protein